MLLPTAASIAAGMSIAGTQNTTSEVSLATNGFNSSINAFASLGVLFIFQFPATIVLRIRLISFFLDILFIKCIKY